MNIDTEKEYWARASKDKELDVKYISDIDTEVCLDGLSPISSVFEYTRNGTLNILDIGCGVGRLAIPIANRYIDFKVCGVDISPEMLKIANKRAKKTKNFETKLCDGRTIPYPDASFMAVYSMLMFQHIPNEAKDGYIKEAARVLQQGGVFRFQFVPEAEEGPVSYGASIDEVTTMCEYAGFKVDQIDKGLVHPQWTWITAIKE